MSSDFGKNINVNIFGESHGKAVGVTLQGIPAGIKIDMAILRSFLDRRKPGISSITSSRIEEDIPEFISGVRNGMTLGSPINAIIYNNDFNSNDYSEISSKPRPGHADFPAHLKYGGKEDYRGGGHFSGRLTAPLCVAGGIIIQILNSKNIFIDTEILEIHGNNVNPMEEIKRAIKRSDSVGGIVKCQITGLPVGIGEPIFDGLENKISQVIFGIPGIKGIEFGLGFQSAKIFGSENNDEYYVENGIIKTKSNNCGGILGGLSTDMPLEFNVAIKPTPSIRKTQNTINYSSKESEEIRIEGRHDPCIVPRALPCIEAATAIALYDLILEHDKHYE